MGGVFRGGRDGASISEDEFNADRFNRDVTLAGATAGSVSDVRGRVAWGRSSDPA